LLIPRVRHSIDEWLTPPAVRLAVLPFEADREVKSLASGVIQDVSNRLAHAGGKLLVIPVSDTERENVRTLEQGKSMFNATHVLRGEMRKNGSTLAISAEVVEVESRTVVRPFKAEYQLSELGLVPKAITGSVAAGLHLREPTRAETVSSAAYSSYIQGIHYLRRDAESGDEAIPFFEKAIELDPNSPLPYAGLAEAQLQNHRRKKGNEWLDLAQASVSKAEARNPDSVPVRLVAGLLKQTRGAYDEATNDFNRAIELDPKSGEVRRRLADLYRNMNRLDDALKTYLKAIEVEPSYYRPYVDLASFYYGQAQYAEADEQYRKVLEIAPELAAGHNGRGLALMEMARYPEAETEFRAALRVRESPYYLNNLGAVLAYLERDAEAAELYQRAIDKGAPSNILYLNLGDSQRRLNRRAEAESAYRKALEIGDTDLLQDPWNGVARSTVAYACARLGDDKRAGMEIAQAIKFLPQDAVVQRLAVQTYETLGKREKSLEILAVARPALLSALSRQPDLAGLRQDPRFVERLTRTPDK
jgi:tetratricopeptide (TPR) repeat protein